MTQTVLIADDHPLFRDAVKLALERALPEAAVVEAGSLEQTVRCLEQLEHCSLLLLDLFLPDVDGFNGLVQIRNQWAEVPIVIVSARDESGIVAKSLKFGANGYISKSLPVEEIYWALKRIVEGEQWLPEGMQEKIAEIDKRTGYNFTSLTPEQLKVLGLIRNGLPNEQIAYSMRLSEATVKAHTTAIFRKLNVRSRTQAVIAAKDLDLPEQVA